MPWTGAIELLQGQYSAGYSGLCMNTVASNECATDNVFIVQVEFEGLEICPYVCNTLADDQQFVQFWEKLSRKTKVCII